MALGIVNASSAALLAAKQEEETDGWPAPASRFASLA